MVNDVMDRHGSASALDREPIWVRAPVHFYQRTSQLELEHFYIICNFRKFNIVSPRLCVKLGKNHDEKFICINGCSDLGQTCNNLARYARNLAISSAIWTGCRHITFLTSIG